MQVANGEQVIYGYEWKDLINKEPDQVFPHFIFCWRPCKAGLMKVRGRWSWREGSIKRKYNTQHKKSWESSGLTTQHGILYWGSDEQIGLLWCHKGLCHL